MANIRARISLLALALSVTLSIQVMAALPDPCDISVSPDRPIPPIPCHVDGCSAVPDGAFTQCCNVHDRVYWEGGNRVERNQADRELQQCVTARSNWFLGHLFYLGVQVGGVPWLPTPWRWGFGWPYEKGHRGYEQQR